MSKFSFLIKKYIENNSEILFPLRFIPYSVRLGKAYKEHLSLLAWYTTATAIEKENFHYRKLNNIVNHAYRNIPFYKDFYDKKYYNTDSFKSLAHFADVPVITKDDLRAYELCDRSLLLNGVTKINTGGTSGSPLAFYIDKNTFAREWAYMHFIWGQLGYSYLDTKLTFRGKNIGEKTLLYNVTHNEYLVNPYIEFSEIIPELFQLAHKKKIKFLHGYPSAIYEFCKYLDINKINAKDLFNHNLKGVFLGSEYPAPQYRELIEKVLNVPTISWYGHSEFSVLAYEKEPFVYKPFPTYGFTEALAADDSDDYKLIATGYYNKAAPFIRYDTGDLIKDPSYENDILTSFSISSGRVGDFIFDLNGKPVSLTALIFGRHHKAFEKADFIQIKNPKNGQAVLVVTSIHNISLNDFDLSNVAIDFKLEMVEKPIRTAAGKLPLLLK